MINLKYSYKSFKRKSMLNIPAKEFNDSETIGSGFYQDEPFSNVFPPDINGVVFVDCNLDNVNIPAGATVVRGTNKHYKTMNDQEYWIVDKQGNPIEPRDKADFIKCKLSILPGDIPVQPLKEAITWTHDPKRIEREKIENLKSDDARLKQILIDSGKLPPQKGGK